MIIVHGRVPLLEDAQEQAMEVFEVMATETREEHGCISYELFFNVEAPNELLIIQQWESVEDMEAHFRSDHMAWFLDQLPDLIDGQVTTTHYQTYAEEGIVEGEVELVEVEAAEPQEELVIEAPEGVTVH